MVSCLVSEAIVDKMKILWVKTELLHPVDKGGKIRTYQMLRELSKSHHVSYLTLDDGGASEEARSLAIEYAQKVYSVPKTMARKHTPSFYLSLARNLLSPLPYAVQRYESHEMRRLIQELAGEHDVVVCDFLAPAINMPKSLSVPSILFQHNVEAMIWARHASVSTSKVRKLYMAEQHRRMFRLEGNLCRNFDHVVAVSQEDAMLMQRMYNLTSVSHVPTGVDTEFFQSSGNVQREVANIVFTGSMDWMPNDDAMLWFIREVLPIVRDQIPNVTLTIVGRSPSRQLMAEAKGAAGVTVTGRVADVRPYLERATVFVVPIRIGGGTRLKIFEAMSMGLPVVSTTIGAEGLPVVDGKSALIRDDDRGFAVAIADVIFDKVRSEAIAAHGQQLVRHNFGWTGVAAEFASACEAVVNEFKSNRSDKRLDQPCHT